MATKEVVYIPYVEAVLVHIELMRDFERNALRRIQPRTALAQSAV